MGEGELSELIIGVRFQVGKFISGGFCFSWRREREKEREKQGVVVSAVVEPPPALQASACSVLSL